jgi:transcriptional regulator with XRE-family HTH domain
MTQTEWRNIFADNLVTIMKEQGVSQSQLAKDAGLSVSRINDYINRRATPTIFALLNLSYALDMGIGELVDFDDHIEN